MIHYFEGNSADSLYRDVLTGIYTDGVGTKPRGLQCLELSPCSIRLTRPNFNIVSNPIRNVNRGFMAAEMMWIAGGKRDVESIAVFNSKIRQFSDDGVSFFGAYGPKYVEQMPYILNILQEDPWTRQAVMTIWRESPPKTKDVPCTVALHFIRRPIDTLNLIVYMRSQDCWLGLPYDLHNFTCFQIMVADALGLQLGNFDLIQGSLHAYQTDTEKLIMLIKGDLPEAVTTTPTSTKALLEQKGEWMVNHVLKRFSTGDIWNLSK